MSAAPTTAVASISPLIAAMGPVLGPFSLLLFSAFIGALVSLSRAEVSTRVQGAMHMVTSMGMSMVLTGACVWVITENTSVPADVALAPVAFLLAAGRPFILDLVQRLFGAAGDFLAGFFTKRG